MATLVIRHPDGTSKEHELSGEATFGRAEGNDVVLSEGSVSRRHARFYVAGDRVVVEDLGSANGTFVDGERVEAPTGLGPRSKVAIGDYQIALEAGARRAAAQADAGRGRRKLLAMGGAVVGLLVVAVVVVSATGGSEAGPAEGGARPPPLDPKAQVERLLSECRSHASTEPGREPKWDKALAACRQARQLDPINAAVLQLLQKIEVERACEKRYLAGKKLINLLREEEALEEFGKIRRECSYYRVVKPMAREAITATKQKAAQDCRDYASRGFWEQAQMRCEKYMTFACQDMSEDELHAPPGFTVDLGTTRCRKSCWRPKDPLYLNLLRARAKKDAAAAPWTCPPAPLFEDELKVADVRGEVERRFKEKYEEPLIREALQLYWQGNAAEAVVKLHKLRAQAAKAALHGQADDLRKDIDAVSNLYRVGSTFLGEEEIDRASQNFREALTLDGKLLGSLAKEKPGFYRRAIEQEMSDQAYRMGKDWADRDDFKKACRIWKQGFGFSHKHPDLVRALGVCSSRGLTALKGARSCDDLAGVLELAVDGDGLKERVEPQRKAWRCGAG